MSEELTQLIVTRVKQAGVKCFFCGTELDIWVLGKHLPPQPTSLSSTLTLQQMKTPTKQGAAENNRELMNITHTKKLMDGETSKQTKCFLHSNVRDPTNPNRIIVEATCNSPENKIEKKIIVYYGDQKMMMCSVGHITNHTRSMPYLKLAVPAIGEHDPEKPIIGDSVQHCQNCSKGCSRILKCCHPDSTFGVFVYFCRWNCLVEYLTNKREKWTQWCEANTGISSRATIDIDDNAMSTTTSPPIPAPSPAAPSPAITKPVSKSKAKKAAATPTPTTTTTTTTTTRRNNKRKNNTLEEGEE
ncbi:hypothetical protein SAMD00019534_062230 [Acytostelium subglobosum LB1]|uniref:hypothetical protein n=1 Tax=Acytostelium subglobosum LB1 TaxID=1410327 RepID=UPI000644F487|nr:hypothetical protein SAMD00019534_062230 [Acytostelium subglobosum LB1]GAM23048.1 hypothetical protein SAMD00019534_062230 [Acytostelium subglobosum LB1]|eukprot:XP_012754275.1 hypothetical protein SAMD00019534_062230 [Acytostelium subglobosum LB1]